MFHFLFSSHLAFAIPLVIIYLLQETGSIFWDLLTCLYNTLRNVDLSKPNATSKCNAHYNKQVNKDRYFSFYFYHTLALYWKLHPWATWNWTFVHISIWKKFMWNVVIICFFFFCWKCRKLFFYTSKKLNKFFSYLWLLIEHWKTPKLDVPLYNFDSKCVQKTISRVWVHIIGGLIFGRSTIIYSVLIAFLLLHSEQSFPISYFFPCRYCPNFTW